MSTLKTDRGNAENGDTRAQRSQRSSFVREEHLDFAKDDIVSRWQFVGFLIHLLFNLIGSAQNWENRVELVESPHPYGQVASVAIFRIWPIVLDV
jgi:hypothetical protein